MLKEKMKVALGKKVKIAILLSPIQKGKKVTNMVETFLIGNSIGFLVPLTKPVNEKVDTTMNTFLADISDSFQNPLTKAEKKVDTTVNTF